MKVLTYAEEVSFLADCYAGITNYQLAEKYDVTLRLVWAGRRGGPRKASRRKVRTTKLGKLDAAVFMRFTQMRSLGKTVPGAW